MPKREQKYSMKVDVDTKIDFKTIFEILGDKQESIIKITPTAFYVRSHKLEQDETEARRLFDGFMAWLEGQGHVSDYFIVDVDYCEFCPFMDIDQLLCLLAAKEGDKIENSELNPLNPKTCYSDPDKRTPIPAWCPVNKGVLIRGKK